MTKQDYLKECLSDITSKIRQSVPINDFNNEYCKYCANQECIRSGALKSSFYLRTSTWKERLFLDIPRATSSDPEIETIQLRWFKPELVNSNIDAHVVESVKEQNIPSSKTELKSEAKVNSISTGQTYEMDPQNEPEAHEDPQQPDHSDGPITMTEPTAIPEKLFESQKPDSTKTEPVTNEVKKQNVTNTAFDLPRFIGTKPDTKEDTIVSNGATFTFGD